MASQIDQLLQEASAQLDRHGFSEELLEQVFSRLEELPLETEEDRTGAVQGALWLLDIFGPTVPKAMVGDLEALRQDLQTRAAAYGPNSPYSATVRITTQLAEALNQGMSDAAVLVAQANAELAGLPTSDLVTLDGPLRVLALQLAHTWLKKREAGEEFPATPLLKIVYEVGEGLRKDGFSKTLVLEAAEALQKEPPANAVEQQTLGLALLHVWGLGLLCKPDAAPALDPLRDRIIELDNKWMAERAKPKVAPRQPEPPTPCGVILNEFAATLERDGYSDYAVQQATNAIQALPQETAEDYRTKADGILRMMDLALPYAPKEAAEVIRINISLFEQIGADTFDDRKFTADEMRAQCEEILEELRESLRAGKSHAPAITQAILKLTVLCSRVPEDSDQGFNTLMDAMLEDFWEALRPYLPLGSENPFQEVKATMGILRDAIDLSNSDDQIRKAAFETQAAEQFGRFGQIYDVRRLTGLDGLKPPTLRFLELFPLLIERAGGSLSDDNEGDKAEIKRMRERYDAPLRMLAAATTGAQIIRQQREGLRRMALESGRFERRNHLMSVHPAFPTGSINTNPNEVFFSGSDAVGELVKTACQTLEMDLMGKHSVQNPTHERWRQLRGSGLAIFDYSAYDPVVADPPGEVEPTLEREAKVLSAAGPVASVAYENGWAFVLGTPMVIVARKDQAVPFDIDLEPVRLEGDGQDAERIALAMQTAIYGVQHGIGGDCLAETLEEVRRVHGQDDDPQVRSLLAALTDVNDATRLREVLTAVIDRIEGGNPLLVLPAFPGGYPSAAHCELFHVSAFREWSKSLQQQTREACERAKVKYSIGFERLNPDIIRIIWMDICRANFVIADITNFNPNAVLELAMAQALGRQTLIMTQNKEAHKYFPALQKVRIHQYQAESGRAELAGLLDKFLSGAQ